MIANLLPYWKPAAIAASLAAAFLAGWTVQGWRKEAARVEAVETAFQAYQNGVQRGQELSAAAELDAADIRKHTAETVKKVYRHAAQSDSACPDAALARRLFNDAHTGLADPAR
jgi:hypothetical protein